MSATHVKFVGWQICFDTYFYVSERCAGSCRWVERVRLIELATRRAPNPWRLRDIFCTRCQREADAFHLQWDKFLERGLFFIYIAGYLSQCSLVPPSCTQILWDNTRHYVHLCYSGCGTARGTGHRRGNDAVWFKIWASGSAHRKTLFENYVGEREKNSKSM